jgi:hypothetical protein
MHLQFKNQVGNSVGLNYRKKRAAGIPRIVIIEWLPMRAVGFFFGPFRKVKWR